MFLLDDDVDDSKYLYDWDQHDRPPKQETFWTAERIEQLRDLYPKGLNTNAIAGLLGTTKNAVISKANRLYLVHGSELAA